MVQDYQDFDLEKSDLKQAETFFKQEARFMLGVANLEQLPEDSLPEIAFAGRSNVGKSSLLNTTLKRRGLARTSNTPGRTQEMNFFNIGDHMHIVDLPGYGYAKVSKSLVKDWTKMLKLYLQGRRSLQMACLLVDARHGIKANDKEMMTMLDEAAVSYQVVLTKADKLKKSDRIPIIEQTQKVLLEHPAAYPLPILTSSEDKTGIDILRARIGRVAGFL